MRQAGPSLLLVAPVLGAALGLLASLQSTHGQDGGQPPWIAGAYSFSDERGGFSIQGVSGSGTLDDPITIRQELVSASPVTLVIRAVGRLRPFGTPGRDANGFFHLRLLLRNASALPWIECEFELQEIEGRPSTFGDGLSFDQRRTESEDVGSSGFAAYSRNFEPYDRLLFRDGAVDAGETAEFRFPVTDFTPRSTFFLIEDPRIPSS